MGSDARERLTVEHWLADAAATGTAAFAVRDGVEDADCTDSVSEACEAARDAADARERAAYWRRAASRAA